jgi:hypothetical protein
LVPRPRQENLLLAGRAPAQRHHCTRPAPRDRTSPPDPKGPPQRQRPRAPSPPQARPRPKAPPCPCPARPRRAPKLDPPPLEGCLSQNGPSRPPPTHPFPLSPLCPKSNAQPGASPLLKPTVQGTSDGGPNSLGAKPDRDRAEAVCRARPDRDQALFAIARRFRLRAARCGARPFPKRRFSRAGRPGRLIRTRPGGRSRRRR